MRTSQTPSHGSKTEAAAIEHMPKTPPITTTPRAVVAAGLGATLVVYGLYAFYWEPRLATAVQWVIFAIAALPLLAPVHLLIKNNANSGLVYALVALPYFAHGSMLLVSPESDWQGGAIMSASGLLFIAGYWLARAYAPPPPRMPRSQG